MELAPGHRKYLTPPAEIKDRLHRLTEELVKRDLGAVWIEALAALYYYTGSAQDGVLIVNRDARSTYVVRKSVERARAESPLLVGEFPGRRGIIQLAKEATGKIGVDMGDMSARDYRRLAKEVGEKRLVDVSAMLPRLRAVKSSWEIEQIEAASRACVVGLDVVPTVLKPGLREIELMVAVEGATRLAGHPGYMRAVDRRFEVTGALVVAGETALYPTGYSGSLGSSGQTPACSCGVGDRIIKTGETVMADLALSFNGYGSDNARVYYVGDVLPSHVAAAHEKCLDCLKMLEDRMKPGAVCGEIFDQVDRKMDALGKPPGFMGHEENRMRFFAHGIGVQLDETPVIAPGVLTELEEGMVLAVEPKAYLPGVGGVGVENTYLVTGDGCRSLFEYPKEIVCCG